MVDGPRWTVDGVPDHGGRWMVDHQPPIVPALSPRIRPHPWAGAEFSLGGRAYGHVRHGAARDAELAANLGRLRAGLPQGDDVASSVGVMAPASATANQCVSKTGSRSAAGRPLRPRPTRFVPLLPAVRPPHTRPGRWLVPRATMSAGGLPGWGAARQQQNRQQRANR